MAACLEDADETESLKKVHGGVLGPKPEAITGIPPKVNTDQESVEEPLSLTIVSAYPGMGAWGFFTPYALF